MCRKEHVNLNNTMGISKVKRSINASSLRKARSLDSEHRDQIHFCLDIRTKQRLEIGMEKGPEDLQGV